MVPNIKKKKQPYLNIDYNTGETIVLKLFLTK